MPTVKHKCPDTGKMMIKKFPYNAVGKVKLDQFMRDPRNKGAKIVKKDNPGYGQEKQSTSY
tara:strand:- start:2327 stop:2509 length:183 start_codon:yes stop_codon:yes gene_type:complete